ncbi:phage protease [Brytella acorum]|uniref:Mu-like prophage I protein n=1 Tax=Brytella acorum TaxID=2959299 RepID=A0AA35UHS9_9PROT|nr:phage protease [Brytella acorum]MDF3623344.1 phage protease [Brytella acorum]CAI9120423.1 hypothetical protein LMG32879_001255 [Brytella acorum]
MSEHHLCLALHTAQGSNVPEWVHLVPAGTFKGETGPSFSLNDANEVVARSMPPGGRSLPLDYNHALYHAAKNGGQAPAAGWIDRMEARPDGIWGHVEWTPQGRSDVAEKRYRFISPVVEHDVDGDIKKILNAALTNTPNLTNLVALNTATTFVDGETAPTDLEQFTQDVLRTMQLPLDTTREVILEKLRKIMVSKHTADPTKFVPVEMFQSLMSQYNRQNSGVPQEVAEKLVHQAMLGHQLLPFMKDWAISLCTQNYAAFQDFIEGAGEPINSHLSILAEPNYSIRMRRKTSEQSLPDNDVLNSMGISPEDVRKYGV